MARRVGSVLPTEGASSRGNDVEEPGMVRGDHMPWPHMLETFHRFGRAHRAPVLRSRGWRRV